MLKENFCGLVLFALFGLLVLSCGHVKDGNKAHHSIKDVIEASTTDSVAEMNIEELMEDMKKVLADVKDTTQVFYVLERQSSLSSFPCSNCHSVPLEQLQLQPEPQGEKKAHWNINVAHADLDVMNCKTCHKEKNLNKLKLINGSPMEFDHSYKLCGQCHSTQYNDWVGGAHGKRVEGWGNPRVINSCVNCHDPHQPAIESRWPARLNTHKLKERDGQ